VMRLRDSNAVIQNTIAVGDYPQAFLFDGANIWVSNWASNTVSKISR